MAQQTTGPAWGGAVGALAILFVTIGSVATFFALAPPLAPEAASTLGALAGRTTVFSLLAALIASLSWSRAKPVFWCALIIGLGGPATSLLLSVAAARGSHAGRDAEQARHLSAAEREPPSEIVVEGRTHLRQAALGIELDAPAGLRRVADDTLVREGLADADLGDDEMVAWRWQSDPPAQMLMLSATSLGAPSASERRRSFDAYLDGQRESFVASMVVESETRASDLESATRAVIPSNGARTYARSLGYERGGRLLVVTVMGLSAAGPEIDAVVDSLRTID